MKLTLLKLLFNIQINSINWLQSIRRLTNARLYLYPKIYVQSFRTNTNLNVILNIKNKFDDGIS